MQAYKFPDTAKPFWHERLRNEVHTYEFPDKVNHCLCAALLTLGLLPRSNGQVQTHRGPLCSLDAPRVPPLLLQLSPGDVWGEPSAVAPPPEISSLQIC